MSHDLVLYTHPMSRGRIARWMLEETGLPYRAQILDYGTGMKAPAYLAINPMGKVPAIVHAGAVVTEQGAIYPYLADLYAEAGLAPPIGDPLRGPYLRWLAFYGACFEPALVDRALKREPPPRAMSPYADCDTVLAVVDAQLARGDYLLGARCSAADVLWGSALGWMLAFGLLDPPAPTRAYAARMAARPAVQRALAVDAAAG